MLSGAGGNGGIDRRDKPANFPLSPLPILSHRSPPSLSVNSCLSTRHSPDDDFIQSAAILGQGDFVEVILDYRPIPMTFWTVFAVPLGSDVFFFVAILELPSHFSFLGSLDISSFVFRLPLVSYVCSSVYCSSTAQMVTLALDQPDIYIC